MRRRKSNRRPSRGRNPGFDPEWVADFKRGGGMIEVYGDGEVVIMDQFDNVQDHYYVKPAFLAKFKQLVLDDQFSSWPRFTRDVVGDDVEYGGVRKGRKKRQLALNPRRSVRRPAFLSLLRSSHRSRR